MRFELTRRNNCQGIICGDIISTIGFLPWVYRTLKPKFRDGSKWMKCPTEEGDAHHDLLAFVPEDRLPLGMVGAFIMPVSYLLKWRRSLQ